MKYLFTCSLFTCFCLAFLPAFAQSQTDPDKVFVFVEEMPKFAGGQDSLLAYLAKNLQYPPEALAKNQSGVVFVSFIVDKQGKIEKPEILKGVSVALDTEALRVISKMPAWKPGKQNGREVAVKYTLPVKFKLSEQKDNARLQEIAKDSVSPKSIKMPQFPGGETAMMQFLAKNLRYPRNAYEHNISGLSVISFIVNPDGTLGDFTVLKKLGYGTDQEAIRIVKKMPLWKPGEKEGKPVKVKYTLPVRFKL